LRRALVLATAVALAAVACGGGDAASNGPTPTAPAGVTGDIGEKPVIERPEGEPPTTLVIEDLVVGDGAEATPGAIVEMHYVGIAWSTGVEFDASWGGATLTYPLGGLIPGWEQGVPGMRVGGRRKLIIPPDLAYGERGSPDIGPNETLVFVIDLLSLPTG